MGVNEALSIINTTFGQLIEQDTNFYRWSWGMHNVKAVMYKGMPTLGFSVNGFLHIGEVFICYNYNSDLYDIYLLHRGCEVRSSCGVYCDCLVSEIDRLVEKNCSDKEYERRVQKYGVSGVSL